MTRFQTGDLVFITGIPHHPLAPEAHKLNGSYGTVNHYHGFNRSYATQGELLRLVGHWYAVMIGTAAHLCDETVLRKIKPDDGRKARDWSDCEFRPAAWVDRELMRVMRELTK